MGQTKFMLLNSKEKTTTVNDFGKLYNFPFFYTSAMRAQFGKNYKDRYLAIAKLIESKSDVVDVCCGDCALFKSLKDKDVKYLGLDISSAFVNKALRNNIQASLFDLRIDSVPNAEYVVLQGSLYQFKNPHLIVRKLYDACKKRLIISEMIKNSIASCGFIKNPLSKMIIPYFVNTENADNLFRFDENNFKNLLKAYNPKYIKAGNDLIAVIDK